MTVENPQFVEGDKVSIKGIPATVKTQVLTYNDSGAAWGQVYALDANGGLIIANPEDCVAQ